jgi:hypothetical protein
VDGGGHDSNPVGPLEKLLEVFRDKEFVHRPDNSHPEKVFQIPVRQKRLSVEIKTQVVERYKAGETVLSIAAAFEIHRCTVFLIIKKAGVSRTKSI